MVTGVFIENVPFARIIIAWGESVHATYAIVDTGFSGDVQITTDIAAELGLQATGTAEVKIANGEVVEVPVCSAIAAMENELKNIEVLIAESIPLIGISFLSKFGYTAIIDCKDRVVTLQK